ncbi:MAG: hypothetical protein COA58_04485 [Bacteroidetes bacterium]|nr:MAG: hypothetical protein COA58_04485 [Bacteroidota bacterium]
MENYTLSFSKEQRGRLKKLAFFIILLTLSITSFAQTSLISANSSWKYLDTDTRPSNWETSGFNDASWSTGNTTAGYGSISGSTINTTIDYGSNSSAKYITTYFRTTFTTTSSFSSLDLDLLCDDGAIIYLNGTEIHRYNMPSGTVSHSTYATSAISGSDEGDFTPYNVPSSAIISGTNTIAVEVHQATAGSSDLGFDLVLDGASGSGSGNTLLAVQDSWKYLDTDTRPTNWETSSFSDASWSTGNTPAGYGTIDDATLNTTVDYGSSSSNKYITTYFRKTFNTSTTTFPGGLDFSLLSDDGTVVYLNGTEVIRTNMPTGTVSHSTLASSAISGSDEGDFTTYNVSASHLVSGANVVAVEVHQTSISSSDIGFDLSIEGQSTFNLTLVNGPYLQVATPTSIIVRWRTGQSSDAKVSYGTSLSSLSSSATSSTSGTEHEVSLSGLSPDTKYYYAIGTTNDDTVQSGSTNFFVTPPTVGTEKATRIWVLGDCGSENTEQAQNRDQYYAYDGAYTDAVLLLGDNAYSNGTDSEYETKFFNYYDDQILRQSPLWPVPGNHDYAQSSARQDDKNVPYYDLFTLPTNAEAGGVASGTESFYSFDLANIHFVALDSYGEEDDKRMSDTTGDQAVWVKQDLAASNQTWKIAYWHHPPYTMGSHNSDNESELVSIRNEFLRMMEQYEVDLILTGHSHNYERTKLMHGHYGSESTFSSSTHNISTSSGEYNGSANSCPYTKDTGDHVGTVYVVSGSAGRATSTQSAWPHNSSYSAYNVAGTFILDIEGGRLDAKFLGHDGVVRDSFTMMKNVNKTTEVSIPSGDSTEIIASWIGDYDWSTGATTRSITVLSDTSIYTVIDGNGCLTDSFIVNSGNSTGPTCSDGVQNGNETGVDCGGPDCPACPTCSDGIQNGNETGVDCGGPDCSPCTTCSDGVQNGSETGIDCGGPDCPACPTCSDGIQNGNETGVDCGGPDCSACPTCSDGIQNGNETGVDCGGPDCSACSSSCTTVAINSQGFESGWGIWNDGGSDCRRSRRDAAYSNGTYSVRLRDNTSTSVVTTDNLDLSTFDDIKIVFSYLARSMDNANEDFWLQVSTNGGTSYSTVASWNESDEFENDIREDDSVTIEGPFTSTTRLRFRCDASGNSDWVYIDDVVITGCQSSSSTRITQKNNRKNSYQVPELHSQLNTIRFYPNPVGKSLSIKFENNIAVNHEYKIYDLQGKVLISGSLQAGNNTYELNINDIPQGLFIIQLFDGKNWSKSTRIMKL